MAAAFAVSPYAASEGASRVPAAISAAVADSHRPATDTMRDADRKPAQVLAFAGIKPGDKIAELVPSGGYMTRLLSDVAGPKGHVYAFNLPTVNDRIKGQTKPVLDEPAYSNVTLTDQDFAALKLPEPVDVVWTSMNYHDFKNPGMFAVDTAAMNKAIFASLKPGGLYIVIDHAAAAGSGTRDTRSLHRIDPETVKSEIVAAGFKLEGQSKILADANDPHTGHSDDKSDKFFFKFRKPR
jgi:predicted methyltransferase